MINHLIKKVGTLIARPTTLKVKEGGEIILKNCSKETVEKVKAFLNEESGVAAAPIAATSTPSVPAAASIAAPAVDGPLECPALGVYQNPLTLNWHLCDIRFSPFTKKAAVTGDRPIGRDKYECNEAFKIGAVTNGLVG